MEQETVLIAGGSGFIGRNLSLLLSEKGFRVRHLSRCPSIHSRFDSFTWDPENGNIDEEALKGTDCVINLAGANIGEARWTEKRKTEIISSRVRSCELLNKTVISGKYPVKVFISSSAVGYYGSVTSENIFTESDQPANDFLGYVCREWESAAELFSITGIRTVRIRTGVVLDKDEGALARFTLPSRIGIFPILGGGMQYIPWIHIRDLCNIYLKAVSDSSMEGPFNAVAPDHIRQKEFMKLIAEVMKKPFFHPNVPSALLRLVLGESSVIALEGSRISSEKIREKGYRFLFPGIREALVSFLA